MDYSNITSKAPNAPLRQLSCVVIDDEPIARQGMAMLATQHPQIDLRGVLSGSRETLEWFETNSADLVFLDIEMPGVQGTELANRLPERTMIVFTTAYSEYAALSYDLDAVDYLLKPIDESKFDRAVQKARLRLAANHTQVNGEQIPLLTLRADRQFVNVDPNKIVYIEGVKDYVKLHTDTERILSRITIKSLLDRLPAHNFARIHKSYIVNIRHVKAYDSNKVTVQSGHSEHSPIELPIGAAHRANVLSILAHNFQTNTL
ncbi:MAG: response regulator transcription factor [Bacteroidales bacterium]|nr:response regulator transcription factor [Bacteroidales bacterium]MBD5222708.1 response regulator transcription factor [Bacteroidales bacterium]